MTMHDQRPAFARWLWRDTTQEHWAYSLAVEVAAQTGWMLTVLGVLYAARGWWLPWVASGICGGGQ